MELTEEDFDGIYQYLAFGRYPTSSSKNERRVIRRRAKAHYRVNNGRLLFCVTTTATALKEKKERSWKLVIRTREERLRILESCHSGIGGS